MTLLEGAVLLGAAFVGWGLVSLVTWLVRLQRSPPVPIAPPSLRLPPAAGHTVHDPHKETPE